LSVGNHIVNFTFWLFLSLTRVFFGLLRLTFFLWIILHNFPSPFAWYSPRSGGMCDSNTSFVMRWPRTSSRLLTIHIVSMARSLNERRRRGRHSDSLGKWKRMVRGNLPLFTRWIWAFIYCLLLLPLNRSYFVR